MNQLDSDYLQLLRDIKENGVPKQTRNGKVLSLFGLQMKHKMETGFPILTTKKVAFKTAMRELRWFLNGDTNIKYLVDNNCHIWDGDAYKAYSEYVTQEWENGAINELFEDGLILEDSTNQGKNISYRKLTQEEFIQKIKDCDSLPSALQMENITDFASKWGELGPIYGKQWIKWQGWVQYQNEDGSLGCGSLWYNQIATLILNLKKNPDSRRLLVSAWNPTELSEMMVPPCHYSFQVWTKKLSVDEKIAEYEKRGYTKNIDSLDLVPDRKISLMWNQRSADVPLGLPFNFVSYGALLHMIANEVNMIPDELIVNIGDAHIYENQLYGVEQQLKNKPIFELPTLKLEKGIDAKPEDFELQNYNHYSQIHFPLSN